MEKELKFEKPIQGENPMEPGFVPALEKMEQAAAQAYFEELCRAEKENQP